MISKYRMLLFNSSTHHCDSAIQPINVHSYSFATHEYITYVHHRKPVITCDIKLLIRHLPIHVFYYLFTTSDIYRHVRHQSLLWMTIWQYWH